VRQGPVSGGNECRLSAACGCDLNPFTNVPGQALRVSQLGQGTIDGKPTFHLRFTITGGPYASTTTDIWIDRSTYLPVHQKVIQRGNQRNSHGHAVANDFTWLPRTRANLAQVAGG
jgi:hypothetical protein